MLRISPSFSKVGLLAFVAAFFAFATAMPLMSTAAESQSPQLATAPPVFKPYPVLLVHGIWGGAGTWAPVMIPALKSAGYKTYAIDFATAPLTMSNEAAIEDQAAALSSEIGAVIADSQANGVHLVCHSMGGLAARYYLEHPDLWQTGPGGTKYAGVDSLIMIGTPNWGTDASFLDPEVGLDGALLFSSPLAVDTIEDWSPPVQEMFAQWEPAPPATSKTTYAYPKVMRMQPWPKMNGGTISPMPESSEFLTKELAEYFVGIGANAYAEDLEAAYAAFPDAIADPVGLFETHDAYYWDQSNTIGTLVQTAGIGTAAPTWGRNARYVSSFLNELNLVDRDTSGAAYFLMAGDVPKAAVVKSPISVSLAGPFAKALPNDGIVPEASAMGEDPFTATALQDNELFPNVPADHRAVFHTYHVALPDDPDVAKQTISWLANPFAGDYEGVGSHDSGAYAPSSGSITVQVDALGNLTAQAPEKIGSLVIDDYKGALSNLGVVNAAQTTHGSSAVTGPLAWNSTGQILTGTLAGSTPDGANTISEWLVRTPTSSVFAGSYSGSYVVSGAAAGRLKMTVSATGAVSATAIQAGVTIHAAGAVDNNGNLLLAYTAGGTPICAIGKATLSGGTLSTLSTQYVNGVATSTTVVGDLTLQ
jgi:pimeloyl-ACP methyl ester carboxylesterase